MDQVQAMRVFVKIAEVSSFAKAAEVLDMSVPRTSRMIAELEDHLGTRLLNRTTRKVSLTEAGAQFLESCRQILHEVEDAWSLVSSSTRRTAGRLRLMAPTIFAISLLAPVLVAYNRLHPNVVVDLVLGDRAVDLVDEQFDLCILPARRVTGLSLVSRYLVATKLYSCASPDYVARHGVPADPSELAHCPYLAFRTERHGHELVFTAPDGSPVSVRPNLSMFANNMGLLRESTLAGMGVATLPAYLVDDDIRSGRLLRLLPEYTLPDTEFRIVYSTRKHVTLKVKAFIEMAIEHFGQFSYRLG